GGQPPRQRTRRGAPPDRAANPAQVELAAERGLTRGSPLRLAAGWGDGHAVADSLPRERDGAAGAPDPAARTVQRGPELGLDQRIALHRLARGCRIAGPE